MPTSSKITACRICGNKNLLPAIDLGKQYLSSIFPENLNYRKTAKRYPLDLVLCKKTKKTCGTLQLGHVVHLEKMYELYPYSSATNSSMTKILQDVADSAVALVSINPGDLILDIGGNDGTLLSYFKDKKVLLLNIDPAKNIKPVFTDPHYQYINAFFSRKTYDSTADKKAKLIFSIAMFYHLANPVTFAKEVKDCLAADGVWIIQMAYLPSMLRTNMYDNIVHEHVGYYSVHTIAWILKKAGLEVFDVTLNNVYGGSFRIFVKQKANDTLQKTKRLLNILADEETIGINKISTYSAFAKRIEKTKKDLLQTLQNIQKQKKTVWIYGASTKGNTIMQYCGLSAKHIVAAADANQFKFGKYMIGADIPIKNEKEMREAKPAYLLALPYSFVNAFIKREHKLIQAGTKFIVPLPEVRILP